MSVGEIEIRAATVADLGKIFAIYNHEVAEGTSTFDTKPRDVIEDERWLTGRERRYPVLVAEAGGAVAGWGSLSAWSVKGGYARTAEVSVYVDAARRGRGIGRQLLTALTARAPRGGIAVLLARIADQNPASIALHEALGFNRVGIQRRSGEKFGRILDVVLMDLHLDES